MDDKLAKTIGLAARAARQTRDLTQEDAADAVGVSSEFYARIERGRTLPSAPTLARIASALGVSADVLLGLNADEPRKLKAPPTEDRALRVVMRRLRAARPSTVRLVSLLLREIEMCASEPTRRLRRSSRRREKRSR